ncbi:MAG: hypothetical protein Q8M26_08685 [Pseudolabrys sp.]|nr:hypothetical protein [Pseudolabrys sp.]
MRSPGGVIITTDPALPSPVERDTFTCGHCNGIVMVQPKQRPEDIGGMCKQCMKLTCPRCTGSGRCDPFMEKLKRVEARYHARRSYADACR